MTLTHASDSGDACDHLRKKPHDAVLIDADLDGFAKTVAAIRGVPYHGPIIGLTASKRANTTEDLLDAGADAVVSRPFKPDHIVTRLLALTDEACEHSGKPIVSDYAKDSRFAEVVSRYIEHVREVGTRLQIAIQDQDADQAREICESLAISGVTFGFPALTEVAESAATSLLASASVAESLPELRNVGRTLQRLAFSNAHDAAAKPDDDAPRLAA
jgi:CheY-like chemotaxis protein